MTRSQSKKTDQIKQYIWPHPSFKKSVDKTWLEGRDKNVSGFCTPYNPIVSQGHEGTKPVSSVGTPVKLCMFYMTCPCTCHQKIDDMYKMLEIPRPESEQSPEYHARSEARRLETQIMLDNLGRYMPPGTGLSSSDDIETPLDMQDPVTGAAGPVADVLAGHADPASEPVFAPTPTGRRARGQLEYDVLTVCIDYAANVFDWDMCTPKNVSQEIGKRYAIEPPSTGAINAVWNRWEKLDFAVQDSKPSRFVKFMVEGASVGLLDSIKSRNKRQAKLSVAQVKRGTLRPRGR